MATDMPIERLRALVKDTYQRLYPQDVDLYIAECERREVHPLSRLIVPAAGVFQVSDSADGMALQKDRAGSRASRAFDATSFQPDTC